MESAGQIRVATVEDDNKIREGLGIDNGNSTGVTPNDVGDPDTGSNNLQNSPVLTAATMNNGSLNITGTLNSTPNKSFRIEYFLNDACNSAGNGEGKTFVGTRTVQTDPSGNANADASFAAIASGQVITATATDAADNTSEFSKCTAVTSTFPTISVNDISKAQPRS